MNDIEDGRKPAARESLPPLGLMALQRSVGNAAVVEMLRRAGHPGAQEQPRQEESSSEQPEVQGSSVRSVLRSSGRPLDEATRTDMETRFGEDFSDVRIHDDHAAKASTAEIQARAYTSGNHVVIGDGGADRHTLAHETEQETERSRQRVDITIDETRRQEFLPFAGRVSSPVTLENSSTHSSSVSVGSPSWEENYPIELESRAFSSRRRPNVPSGVDSVDSLLDLFDE